MKTVISPLIVGGLLLAALVLLLSGCPRKDYPPKFNLICTLDGFGGGDCVSGDGAKVYKAPSEMANFWATDQESQERFAAWCWKTTTDVAAAHMQELKSQMYAAPSPSPDVKMGDQPEDQPPIH